MPSGQTRGVANGRTRRVTNEEMRGVTNRENRVRRMRKRGATSGGNQARGVTYGRDRNETFCLLPPSCSVS